MKKIVILLALLLLSSSTIYAIEDNSSKEIDKDVEEEILFEDTTNVIFGEVSKKEIYSLNNYSSPIQGSGASVDVITREDIHAQNTPEISKLLKLKEVTVRARINRGRIKLLQMLERRNLNDR